MSSCSSIWFYDCNATAPVLKMNRLHTPTVSVQYSLAVFGNQLSKGSCTCHCKYISHRRGVLHGSWAVHWKYPNIPLMSHIGYLLPQESAETKTYQSKYTQHVSLHATTSTLKAITCQRCVRRSFPPQPNTYRGVFKSLT